MRDRQRRALKPPIGTATASDAPGRRALVAAAVILGALMLALQLWLLTTALDLYLAGEGDIVWQLAAVSALVFAGGLLALLLTSGESQPPVQDQS